MDFEQIDFFIKNLGLELKKYVISIRIFNIFNILRGLQRFWEKLDECLGVLEYVEVFIRFKLLSFLKLGNKDYQKLYDFLDIFMEMQFLKENLKYSVMLVYLDFLFGIRLIIFKLLYGLQEKWMS